MLRLFSSIATVSVLMILLLGCRGEVGWKDIPKAKDGVLDLRDWNFMQDGTIALDGEWLFYWQKLLTPSNFDSIPTDQALRIDVPGIWNGFEIDGIPLKGHGYATYGLTVLLPKQDNDYALKIRNVVTAFAVWVNDSMVATNGVVGINADESSPFYDPQIVPIRVKSDTLRLAVQISNFHHRKGGFIWYHSLGITKAVYEKNKTANFIEGITTGSILIIALYHLLLYIYRKKERNYFYFAGMCLMVGLRLLFTGQYFVVDLVGNIPWAIVHKVEYCSYFLAFAFSALFLYKIFRDEFPRLIIRIILFTSYGFSTFVIVTSTNTASYTIIPYQIFTLLIVSYMLFVIIRAVLNHRPQASWVFVGTMLFAVAFANDVLHANQLIYTGFIIHYGLLFFIFTQATILAIRNSRAFSSMEKMSGELQVAKDDLEEYSQTLEIKVEDRTQHLRRANKDLSDFAHVVSHDLKAPLRGLSLLADWLHKDYADKLDQDAKEHLTLMKERVSKMNQLIVGVLKYSKVGIENVQKVDVDLNLLVKEVIELVAPPPNISVNIVTVLPTIKGDPVQISQVFQNFVGNAIKYMDKDIGKVEIACAKENGMYKFSVSDNGPGIKPEDQERIFQMFQTIESRDKSDSTGIGLAIVKKIVESYGGKIWVESEYKENSTFYFTFAEELDSEV